MMKLTIPGQGHFPIEEKMQKPIISADSHITEPPGTYVDRSTEVQRHRAAHGP